MKKIVVLMCLIFVFGCFMYSCKDEYVILCNSNITEVRKLQYEYISEEFYVSFWSGQRENPYVVDGRKNEMIDYGVIKLDFFDKHKIIENLFLSVSINSDDYIVNLEQNPFDNSYMYDIKHSTKESDNVFVKVKYNEKEFDIALIEFTQNFEINYEKAFLNFINTYKELINNYIVYGDLHGEFHITLLEDISLTQNEKFWYIGFFTENNNYSVCIDTKSGKILAQNFK